MCYPEDRLSRSVALFITLRYEDPAKSSVTNWLKCYFKIIYNDSYACHMVKRTKSLKFVAIFNATLGLIYIQSRYLMNPSSHLSAHSTFGG